MVHVRGDHEIILILYKLSQVIIDRLWRGDITVIVDMPCPPCPAGLCVREGIETAGIHIPDAKPCRKISEILLETLPTVDKTRSRGKTCSGPDYDGIGGFDFYFQTGNRFVPGEFSFCHATPEIPDSIDSFIDRFQISVRKFTVILLHSMPCPHL